MKIYKVYKDNELVFEAHSQYELDDFFEYSEHEWHEFDTVEVHSCKGCSETKEDVQERSDYHGIFTGHYCEDCYENNYPYRKDDYTHGTGVCDDGTPIEDY